MSEDIVTRLNDEADQCKNDGADDIASLLWEASSHIAGLETDITERDATIAALRSEVEGLRKDAERYRWLRENARVQPP